MYGCNIFGVRGTLGSDNSMKLLYDIYSVDMFKIPTIKPKRLIYDVTKNK